MFICLYRHFLPHVGLYDVEEARGVDGALHVQVGDAERRVGGPGVGSKGGKNRLKIRLRIPLRISLRFPILEKVQK